jgi:hypothetical protein
MSEERVDGEKELICGIVEEKGSDRKEGSRWEGEVRK